MSSIENPLTISEFLSSQMERRKRKNVSYSIRAFARDIGLSPSHLSEVLRGSEGLSEKKAEEVAKNLRLKQKETRLFLDLILAERGRTGFIRQSAKERIERQKELDQKRQLKDDEFKLISDWYHAAIVELLSLDGFVGTEESVADYLGIPVTTASEALQRLERLRLVRREELGCWSPTDETSLIQSQVPSTAIRKFHRQMLERAIEEVITGHPDERCVAGAILAVPEEAVSEMTVRITQLVSEICSKYAAEPKEQLYAISAQFFPVRKRKR